MYKQLAEWLITSAHTTVLTGAGMSTESGVPDFRSSTGLWRNVDPKQVATVEAMEENYPLFYQFYAERIHALQKVKPHIGHDILANWERRGLITSIATQNVDGLHQAAGSKKVIELHGSIRQIRCRSCRRPVEESEFLQDSTCKVCKGNLRPGVVLFGEMLPEQAWQQAYTAMEQAELVLVMGTSLEVFPVNQLPFVSQGKIVMINLEPVHQEERFDLATHGKVGEVLQKVDDYLE